MSRHRAEPDDEDPLPPPTADTGPLMFGQGDWPLLRPPEPSSGNGRPASLERVHEQPSDNHRADNNHLSRNDSGENHAYPKYLSEPRSTFSPDLHNHMTSEIAYPVRRQPVVPVGDNPPRVRPALSNSAPAKPPVVTPPSAEEYRVDELADAAFDHDALVEDAHLDDPADELGLLTPEPLVEKGHRRGRRSPRDKGRRRPLAVLLSLAIIAALVTGIFYGGRAVVDLISTDPAADYTGEGADTVEIEISDGASTAAIADVLVENDVVASSQAFLDAAAGNPDILTIQPGVYSMRLQMSGQAALDLILDPASRLFDRATIPEGFTVAHTLESLADQTDIPLTDYQAAAAAPEQLGLPAWANGQLEGFLYPETYDVGPDTTAVEVLTDMVAQFNQVATETGLEANAAAVGLTPYQVLTIASLIQAEVTVEAERPVVARVIYNRLTQSMPLGIDAALAYALQVNGNQLTTEMLTTDSPYNTRIRLGLPPTPISNPGQPSIVGALQPAVGDWLYYVLQTSEGDHFFTASYEEFLAAKAQCEAQGLGCG